MVRGNTVMIAVAVLGIALMTMSAIGFSDHKETRDGPIEITGDAELRQNACGCIKNPSASGNETDPFIIGNWIIDVDYDPGIVVRDIDEEHFIVRENTVDAPTGIKLINTGDRGDVVRNKVTFEADGIHVENAHARIVDNDVQAVHSNWDPSGDDAIYAEGGSPLIRGNHLSAARNGIHADGASATIEDNVITSNRDGVRLVGSTSATLTNNVIKLSQDNGLEILDSSKATLNGNHVRGGDGGVVADGARELTLKDNTIENVDNEAVRFVETTVTMYRNVVKDNWRGAVGSSTADLKIRENHFANNGDDAVRLEDTRGEVSGNTFERNEGTAVVLQASEDTRSIVTLEDNTLRNNTFAFSIPYENRQSIDLMSGNMVNGVNVDGTINPDEQRFFYKDGGVRLNDTTVDAGGSAYYGVHAEQGAVIVYDSPGVVIENVTFTDLVTSDPSDGKGRAIYAESTFNLRIRNNTFQDAHEAVVVVDARAHIKDNVCEISVDPATTVCIEVRGGFANVRANVVTGVDVGIRLTASAHGVAEGNVENNEVLLTTQVGIELKGSFSQDTHDVVVASNKLEANAAGMALIDFHGFVKGNVIGNSTGPGIELHARSNATIESNIVVHNEDGIFDAEPCWSFDEDCSSGDFEDNTVRANSRLGIFVGAGGTFEGDVVADNEVGIEIRGDAVLDDVTVESNERVGIEASGQVGVHHSEVVLNGKAGIQAEGELRAEGTNASANGQDGINVEGRAELEATTAFENEEDGVEVVGSASAEGTNTSFNGEAGMRLEGSVFVVSECEASFNADGVVMADVLVNVEPDLDVHVNPPDPPDPDEPGDDDDADPLFMTSCDLVGNADYALRATTTTFVNATLNFWGDKNGPRLDLPGFEGDNVVSAHAVVSPYYKTRDHTVWCTVPSTEVVTPPENGCLEFEQ